LNALNGSWGITSPISYSYQWRRCDSAGTNCADIPNGTTQNYIIQAADVGHTIRVVVTAWNTYGSGSATSNQTGVIVHIGS
jgi:hypothetical protein